MTPGTSGWTRAPAGGPGTFELRGELTIQGVAVPLRLGGQAWGELNAARDNAVLVCHHYTGTMRAAGRNPDGTPGWWDTLIGPGRALDTDRYHVVCLNTLGNVQVQDPAVVTTGPATPHPDGRPWGERFPAWTMADLHAAQRGLLRALGAPHWHAVTGPSFGGMQALQWAARTPALAPRVAAIVSSPVAGPVLRGVFGPVLRSAASAGGASALHETLRVITFFGLGADGLEATFRRDDLDAYLRTRTVNADLAHVLEIGRAVQTHDITAICPPGALHQQWREHGTRLLSVNVRGDQFFPAAEMRDFAAQAQAAGVTFNHLEFDSPRGHLGGLADTDAFEAPLRALLESDARPPVRSVPEVRRV
ncbi:alpha/beta fold hydrolase [Deinococcus taeanensis]|uniref:alpha/beta fold hydrolase n=1 Tax=Deinococcus taeanensis TaxID=2737050 RepID=UPI001CDB787A|nr:alpha/beta fold hydrolase [Deinococcus taeanensis]UBV41634.1 alpha/beta fold hydrolase [Deinococcus taeanensis]